MAPEPGLTEIEQAVLGLRTDFLEMRLSYAQVIAAMVKINIPHPTAVTIADSWDEEWSVKFDNEAPPPGPVIRPKPHRPTTKKPRS